VSPGASPAAVYFAQEAAMEASQDDPAEEARAG